jgi:hypothetical protein
LFVFHIVKKVYNVSFFVQLIHNMNSLIKTAVCSAIAGIFLAGCGGGGGGSSDAGNSGSGSGSGTGGPVTPPVVTARADILMGETGGAAYLDGQGDTARFFYLKILPLTAKVISMWLTEVRSGKLPLTAW